MEMVSNIVDGVVDLRIRIGYSDALSLTGFHIQNNTPLLASVGALQAVVGGPCLAKIPFSQRILPEITYNQGFTL